jgi:S-adenosylmethionine hydrolase
MEIKGHFVSPVAYYAQAAPGALNCLVNSSGYLEIFSCRDSASRRFEIGKGDAIVVVKRKE